MDKICECKFWNDCVRENISSLYYVLKSHMKQNIEFCLYHQGLISISHHFIFCGRTCQLNDSICQFCSKVIYENSDSNEKCRRVSKDVKLIDVCNRDIIAIFHNSVIHKNDGFIALTSVILILILYLLTQLINKVACYSKLVTIKKIFVQFSRKYLCEPI